MRNKWLLAATLVVVVICFALFERTERQKAQQAAQEEMARTEREKAQQAAQKEEEEFRTIYDALVKEQKEKARRADEARREATRFR